MTQIPNGLVVSEVNNNTKGVKDKKLPSSAFPLSKFIALPQGLRVKSQGNDSEGKVTPRKPLPVKALPSGVICKAEVIEDLTEANNNVFIHLEHCENNSSERPLIQHTRNLSVSSVASSQDGSITDSDGSLTPRTRSGRYRKRSQSTPPDIGRQRSSPVDRRIGKLANQYYQAVYNNKQVNTADQNNWSRHSYSSDTGICDQDSDNSLDLSGDIEDVDFSDQPDSSTPLDYYQSTPVSQLVNASPPGVKTMMHPHYLTLPRNTKFHSDNGLLKVDNSLRPMAYVNGTLPRGHVMTQGGSLKIKSQGLVVYQPPRSGEFIMVGNNSLNNDIGKAPFKSYQGVGNIHEVPSDRVRQQEISNLNKSRGLSASMPTLLGNASNKEQKKFLKEVKKLEKEEKKRREKEEKRRLKEEKKRERTLRKQKKYANRTLPKNWGYGHIEKPIENVYHRRPQLQLSAVPIDFEDGPSSYRSVPPPNSPPPPPPSLQQGPSLKAQAFYNSAPDLLRLEKVYGGSLRGTPKEFNNNDSFVNYSIPNGGFTLHRNIPNTQYYSEYAPRSVVLQKGPEGFGFVLRGAKSQTHATAELDFRPTAEFPALQYLDSVDPGSRSDRAGLKSGDFILEINGENVVRASHDRVVQLIRQSGDTLALKVVTVKTVDKPDHWHQNGSMTLPNRGGGQSKRQAPQPPQRDPHTSLSFTKTQGKQIAEGMAELERNVEELNSATNDQLDLALAEYERQSSQSVITSEQKTASIRSKHSAKRVSCIELDKIENPDAMSSTTNTKVKSKDYMSPSELRIQKYHHNKKTNGLERSSSTPSLLDTKKNETVYATPSVPSVEQSEIGHRRSSSGATSHIYATPGERPKAPPPPPPGGSTTPKRPAPAPPSTKSEVVTINTENRKSSYSGVTEVSVSSGKSASEYESSFRPGISAQLSTEPKITTPSLEHAKLKSHSRNSSQISLQSSDSAGSKRSEEKLAVTFAEDKVQEHAKSFLQKHPNAQLLVTADVHDKNKLRKFSEPEPDYEGNSDEEKDKNKVTVINVGVKPDSSKKYKIHSDIPSSSDIVIPPPPSEPAPKPPSQKPPSPLPKPNKQADSKPRLSVTEQIKVEASLKSAEEVSPAIPADVSIPPPSVKEEEAPPIPQAPPPPPPPPAPPLLVESNVNKPKTPPPVAKQKPVSPLLQGIQKEDLLNAVEQRKNRMENEGLKISKGPNKEAPVKNSNDLRSRMIDNTQAAILAAVAKRRALLEEKESDTAVADEIENRLQKTKKLQSAKYYFSSETIQKEKTNNAPKIDTKLEASAKDITPTIDKVKTPTPVALKVAKPPSPGTAKKNKPPSPIPIQKAKPATSSEKAKVTSPVKKDSTSGITKQPSQTSKSSGIPVSTKTRPPSPKVVRKEPVKENTIQDKKPDSEMKIEASNGDKKTENVNGDKENEDFVAKAEKARRDWLQKKSSSSSIKQNSPRDGTKSKPNSPRRAPSDVAKNSVKVEVASVKKDVVSAKTGSPKTNGMTLPLKNDTETERNSKTKGSFKASSPIRTTPLKTPEKSGIIPMKATKDSDVISKTKNIKDRIKNFEQGKPVMNGEVTSPKSKISVQGVTMDHSVTDKSPALPPPPEFGDAMQLEIIPPPTEFNINDNLESPTYNSAFQHDDSSSVSTMSTLSDDHMDGRSKSSYEDMIAPPPPGFDDNSNFEPSVIPPPPDFGENKSKLNKNVSKPFQSKSVDSWQCLDVLDWLDSVNMAQYKKSFQQHCIDGKKLSGLQRNDYIQLGVTQVGHRMTMERSIKKANLLKGTHL